MFKKTISMFLALLIAFSSLGICNTKAATLRKNVASLGAVAEKPIKELTPAERRKLGYVRKPILGVEYKSNLEVWKKYDDFVYVSYPAEGDTEDTTKAIYDGKYVSFISSPLLKEYDETSKITDKAKRSEKRKEILGKGINIYSLIVYRKDKLPKEDQIKKDVKLPTVIKLGEDGGYVFYFGIDEYNDKTLPKEDIEGYKALYDDAVSIKETMMVFKPVSSEEGIKSLGKLQFKLNDLEGKELTDKALKENKITMINIWATYCGYCKEEMPYIQELADKYKDKKFGVIGIVGDLYSKDRVDEVLLEKAKQVVKDTKIKFQSLIPDEAMKYDSLMQYLLGYPTTVFVDSEGNIVGDVIIGSVSMEEFEKRIINLLELPAAEKRALGYTRKPILGMEYKTNIEIWKKYDDFVYIDYPAEGDSEDVSKAIYDGKYTSFISSPLLKEYDETSKITDKAKRSAKRTEILNKGLGLYSFVIYRKDKLPKEDQIQKDIKYSDYVKLGEKEGYIFYFGLAEYNDKDLSKEDKIAYKSLYDDAIIIRDSMTIFKPIGSSEGIKSIGKLQFKVKNLSGKEVTEAIFKENKLTMVNLWATYCGYCIEEMPYIKELASELKSKGFGVVGIAGDVFSNGKVDEKLLEKAKKIVAEQGLLYENLIPDEAMRYDSIMQYLVGYPTTFFVDSEGQIIGDVIIGSLTKEEFQKAIDKVFSELK